MVFGHIRIMRSSSEQFSLLFFLVFQFFQLKKYVLLVCYQWTCQISALTYIAQSNYLLQQLGHK